MKTQQFDIQEIDDEAVTAYVERFGSVEYISDQYEFPTNIQFGRFVMTIAYKHKIPGINMPFIWGL